MKIIGEMRVMAISAGINENPGTNITAELREIHEATQNHHTINIRSMIVVTRNAGDYRVLSNALHEKKVLTFTMDIEP